jgi:hypothetical protein
MWNTVEKLYEKTALQTLDLKVHLHRWVKVGGYYMIDFQQIGWHQFHNA